MDISDASDAARGHGAPFGAEVVDSTGADNEGATVVDSTDADNEDTTVVDSTDADGEDEEVFIYPAANGAAASQPHPSPEQLEDLFSAASSGDLDLLKEHFKNALDSGVEFFSLANDATPRTGSTALHAAASRGYIDIVAWLIEHCGAIPDLEDREGETALHRASLHGHLNIVQYLMGCGADICAKDADGWTALHNACSKGYLDIVRCLCEDGKLVDNVCGVNVRNKDGWTPLMNASSKGHLPIVLYLVRQGADPLIRNKWGETAYDTAAAVFQVWICEVLQQVEAERWQDSKIPYNPLAVHTTLPVIIHENEKLDTRLKTLAVSGPTFSASGLGRRERRPPFEIMFPKPSFGGITAWGDVQLPFRVNPEIFPEPGKPEKQTADTDDHSHFWLSEWIVDVTHPKVDARDGWQYAHEFTDPDEQWTAERPPSLERLLKDGGVVAGSVRTFQNWVRRRRWVRLMRRRIDIPPLPFLQPGGDRHYLPSDDVLVPCVDQTSQDDGGEELSVMAPTPLSSAQDYVARARCLAGGRTNHGDGDYPSSTATEMRHSIAKLERATTELRRGILGDEESDIKTQAEVLLNVYNRELERLRLAAGARGWSISSKDDSEGEDDSSDEKFLYPGAPTEDNLSVSRASMSTTYTVPRGPIDLTPQLSQAPDFRVPTREAPQRRKSFKLPRLWSPFRVPDSQSEFIPQKLIEQLDKHKQHHCRKCGQIFCDTCSAFRTLLDPPQVPSRPDSARPPNLQRVCRACYADVTESLSFQGKPAAMEPIIINTNQLNASSATGGQASRFGNFLLCPVCNSSLVQLKDTKIQTEDHIKECLERTAKYLVYDLPAEKGLIGTECILCPERFVKGSTVARLSCLCSFHNSCLAAWLQRGKGCPEHAR